MLTKMFNFLASILGFVLLLNLAMFFFQEHMIFFPHRSMMETPADWGMDYQDVLLQTTDDVQLHGWYIPSPNAKRTLLFFHGNAGNISHRGDSIRIFHRLGLNVFIPDYRGYGKSQGRPSESGLYHDAHASWQYLLSEKGLQAQDIIVFGRSLGGAVAIKLAGDVRPRGLILESVFSSISDMADSVLPGLSRLLFKRFQFDNQAMIQLVHSPVLFLHSPNDDIIPFVQGKKVFQAAHEPKHFVQLQGDHNSGFLQSQPDYERQLASFLRSLEPETLRK